MINIQSYRDINYDSIPIDKNWNEGNGPELKMHTIHAYPAKFPAFMAEKAFHYAQKEGVTVASVADIFCGCGTVALESKRNGFSFWGCDINPVATLIARVKSSDYNRKITQEFFEKIASAYQASCLPKDVYDKASERLQYWFTENSYIALLKIYNSIDKAVDEDQYKEAFLCLFSAILKASSKWLTKSIKPQIDPRKKEIDVWQRFELQYKKFIKALEEISPIDVSAEIEEGNFLELEDIPKTDLIVTSPPYVTSYEYADLHQLSSLWLRYTDDYRTLRKASIGSRYNSEEYILDEETLNSTGKEIVHALKKKNVSLTNLKAVARYFSDMQMVVEKCATFLKENGMIFFVVGDTEYKGVEIQNSKHLIESLLDNGYMDIKISKRIISKGICVPYRDESGKFSADKTKREVYHEEFIISGRMPK